MLDLGAGDGAITAALLEARVRVIAFELHPARAASLRRRFEASAVKVVQADVGDLRLPTRPFHVVANPPFAVISPVLDRLTSRHSALVRADIAAPVAVARRWTVRLGERRRGFAVVDVRPLPRSVFTPRPHIDCCTLTISRQALR